MVAVMIAYMLALTLAEADAYSHGDYVQYGNGMRINRRGFKSSLLSTARGFGKRSDPSSMDFLNRAAQNPRFMAYVLNRMDEDGDGILTPEEMSL